MNFPFRSLIDAILLHAPFQISLFHPVFKFIPTDPNSTANFYYCELDNAIDDFVNNKNYEEYIKKEVTMEQNGVKDKSYCYSYTFELPSNKSDVYKRQAQSPAQSLQGER